MLHLNHCFVDRIARVRSYVLYGPFYPISVHSKSLSSPLYLY